MGGAARLNGRIEAGESMKTISDRDYLRNEQYKTVVNLGARAMVHERFSTNPYGYFRWQFEALAIQAGDRVLDIGCGPAGLWAAQRSRLPQGVQVVCCDLSHGMVTAARTALQADERFRFGCGDVQRLPFATGMFHLVTANHMLYHVPDIGLAAHELRRVLAHGGRLVAATNGALHLQELRELFSRVDPQFTVMNDSAARFGLENGIAQLAGAFAHYEVKTYADSLWVTEVEPLVEYARSSWGFSTWDKTVEEGLRHEIAAQIAARGGFAIQKSVGIVSAFV